MRKWAGSSSHSLVVSSDWNWAAIAGGGGRGGWGGSSEGVSRTLLGSRPLPAVLSPSVGGEGSPGLVTTSERASPSSSSGSPS